MQCSQMMMRCIDGGIWQELKKHQVFDIVRVCEPTYATKQLEDNGISVLVTVHCSL